MEREGGEKGGDGVMGRLEKEREGKGRERQWGKG